MWQDPRVRHPEDAFCVMTQPLADTHCPNRDPNAPAMDSVLLDIRFALRSLRRRPVFAVVAIATIALSIGAATAVYSVVDGVLFRSLPYRAEGKLVVVWQTDTVRKKSTLLSSYWDRVPLDYTDFMVWRAKQTSYTNVGVWSRFGAMRTDGDAPEQVTGGRVSPGFFEVLGVHPAAGRSFLPGEDVLGGPHVTMLGYDTWISRFGGRNDVVGTTVRFDDKPYEIIGVLPKDFTIERGRPGFPFWIPAGQSEGDVGKQNRGFIAIGRMKPGVTVQQAALETQRLLNATNPAKPYGIRISDFVRDETREVRAPLLLLLGAVGLLLLIACVNIATLLLGEAATRDLEISARVALGASRGRIARQLLTESLLLSGIGSILGVLLAWWGTRVIVALAPQRIPGIGSARVDGHVLFVAFLAAAITGILFGCAPAFTLSTTGPASLLRGAMTVRGGGRLQRIMIAAELALSVVLLIGAGLLSRSLQKLSAVDPGFRADHLLTVQLRGRGQYWKDTARLREYYAQAMPRLRALPGVQSVSVASVVPFSGSSSSSPFLLPGEGDAERASHKHEVQQAVVEPNYFSLMGIPLVAGRAFSSDDNGSAPLVAIITEATARRDFPSETAIGQRVLYHGQWVTIVGIVRDVKIARLSADMLPGIYTPLAQRPDELPQFVIRSRGEAAALASAAREALRGIDPTITPVKFDVMSELVTRSFDEERFRTALIVLFGAMAAVLAAVGLFGVTTRAVSRRTREVGIRVALGAETRSVVAMIVNQTMRGVAAGSVIGAVVAFIASQSLTPYLFGVTAHDPLTYAAIVVFLGSISILASWLPARRAGRIEPAIVLRNLSS
jgi:putative ABC transport system permease protein